MDYIMALHNLKKYINHTIYSSRHLKKSNRDIYMKIIFAFLSVLRTIVNAVKTIPSHKGLWKQQKPLHYYACQ